MSDRFYLSRALFDAFVADDECPVNEIHVIPPNDPRNWHRLSAECQCRPVYNQAKTIASHNALRPQP